MQLKIQICKSNIYVIIYVKTMDTVQGLAYNLLY